MLRTNVQIGAIEVGACQWARVVSNGVRGVRGMRIAEDGGSFARSQMRLTLGGTTATFSPGE